jgi:hypothetical protein
MLPSILLPAASKCVITACKARADVNGARIVIALERFHRAHGHDAPDLQSLVPAFLPAMLSDAISGQPWCYRVLDKPDEFGRRYLLYSVGSDGTDNGGQHRFEAASFSDRGRGFDYVIDLPRD